MPWMTVEMTLPRTRCKIVAAAIHEARDSIIITTVRPVSPEPKLMSLSVGERTVRALR